MPRIPTVSAERAGVLGRLAYRIARRRYGAVPEPATVSLQHPGVFWTWTAAELLTERAVHRLPARLAGLVVHRVATTVDCSFCVDFGAMLWQRKGLDAELLRALDGYPDSPLFDDIERLALTYADAATATPPAVTDELVAGLDAALGHDGLVELTWLVALENLRSRFNSALGITEQGFTSGAACQLPVTPPAAG